MGQEFFVLLYKIGDRLIYIYMLVIVVSAFLSWVPNLYNSRFGELLRRFSDPLENMIRRIIPPIMGLDFSPIIGIFLCEVIRKLWAMIFRVILLG
ncbi:YggT family protein [Xylocopilactobacillus apicola]|uniref:Cell division protein n=1 Tax=Xylocopilactobacillus apicola TaxID=2932184 RepID=A0AAU9D7L4_9LACO|nr:YggT family protein [Xylocopilactobacillus apicola]BDR58310.1 cell division protein [Xylocopilactobacillus apicola]